MNRIAIKFNDPVTINKCVWSFRSSHPEVFLGKAVLKITSKFTGEHPCRSAISIKLQSNFIEITLRHECSLVNLLHIFRTAFPKNTSEQLVLVFVKDLYQLTRKYYVFHLFFTITNTLLIFTLYCLKSHTYLNKPVTESYMFV